MYDIGRYGKGVTGKRARRRYDGGVDTHQFTSLVHQCSTGISRVHCGIGLNERLNLNISSVEINGRILYLDYEAYDYDGNKGIYCPETSVSRNSRTVADQAVSTGTSIVGGRLGSVANAVVRTGASLFRNASGESYVNLKSGYEFYIMKKQ